MSAPRLGPLLFVASSGCILFSSSLDKGDGAAGRYTGDECSAIELDEDVDFVHENGQQTRVVRMSSPQPARTDALPVRVAKVACGDTVQSYPPDGGASAYVQYHHDFDARRFDHATAALILTMCNKTSDCIGPVGPNTIRPPEARHYEAGQLAFYAEKVDPKRVDAQLEKAGVSAGLRSHFLAQLEAARAEVKAIVKEIPAGAAEVLVGIPKQVYERRAAEDARHAELYARFDALAEKTRAQREKGPDDATIAALEDLRGDWVKACGEIACMERALGVLVARELFFAHVARQDGLGAQVERKLADPETPIEAAMEIERLQAEAMSSASETHRKREQLRDQGLDESTARAATAGADAYDFSQIGRWKLGNVRTVQWAQLVPGGAEPRHHGGKLKAKKQKGALTVLEFADVVDKYADEACRETNRVERIESDGRLVYEQRCRRTGKTNVYRTKIDPVVVPAREAKPLQIGDDVHVFVGAGEPKAARVSAAMRKDEVVQRRDVRPK
jgi:hypothetical protein